MLQGYGGHLIAEGFLERYLAAPREASPVLDATRRGFLEWRRGCRALGPASSLRTLFEVGAAPLVHLLGFSAVSQPELARNALVATLTAPTAPLLLLVAGWAARLDPLWPLAVVHAGRREAQWCLLYNGAHARLIDARRLYSRRSVDLDLDLALDDDTAFGALWTLLRAESFAPTGTGDPPLVQRLVDASERHGADVCRSLRNGVLEASGEILRELAGGGRRAAARGLFGAPRALEGAYEQALTIVYRILFLLFAEARGLVPLWHPVYREGYSLERLRVAAERRRARGLWDALRAACRLAHTGCRAGDLRVTGFNGRLFAPSRTPLADRADLDDEAAARALVALSTRPARDREGREPIAYRDLDVEQLGAVYETLLDYAPCRTPASSSTTSASTGPDARPPSRVVLQTGSGRRKATGTFYTPRPLARFLVRRTLGPLVRDASPERILELRVLDPAMGSGAFLVAACQYLVEAFEAALVRDGRCHPSDLGPRERAASRRLIVERCLYGVDVNPMAVQLARLSLWLATLAADRPLSFLDHHLVAGDSLVGAWLSCLRRPPIRRSPRAGRRELPLFDDAAAGEALREALPVRFTLACEASETPAQVREKERALAALNRRGTMLSRWRRVADLWCARWFSDEGAVPSAMFAPLSDHILTGRSVLPERTMSLHLAHAETVAAARRFFHWELEFPEAFFDPAGTRLDRPGFDAVIGNPPWDMLRGDAGSPEERAASRADVAALRRFVRDAAVYSAQSDGHANRYQLFLERALALTRPGGRFGLVLPSGAIGDHGSAALRRLLWSRGGVDAVVGFENRLRIFPVHRSLRFLLLTGTSGAPSTAIGCRLGERDPAVLETDEDETGAACGWFPVHVTPALLERLGGADLAVPDLRGPLDLAIAERAAALHPPLGADEGWGVRFGRELNATDDRPLFGPPGGRLPVVEGKQIEPFRVDLGQARWGVRQADAARLLGARHERARLAYREVAAATNRLTLIAAVLPAGCVSTHTVSCLRTPLPPGAQRLLCGLLNSLVLNYLARLRVTTHVTTVIVEGLPVPRPDSAPAACREIARLARVLARRQDGDALARLNARVAHLYALTREEFAHLLGTFPLVPSGTRAAALREYERMPGGR